MSARCGPPFVKRLDVRPHDLGGPVAPLCCRDGTRQSGTRTRRVLHRVCGASLLRKPTSSDMRVGRGFSPVITLFKQMRLRLGGRSAPWVTIRTRSCCEMYFPRTQSLATRLIMGRASTACRAIVFVWSKHVRQGKKSPDRNEFRHLFYIHYPSMMSIY